MEDLRKRKAQSGKKIPWRLLLCVFLSLVLLGTAFAGGYALRYYTEDPYSRTLRWVKSMVRQYYYRDIPEEDLSGAGLETLFGSSGEPLLDIYSAYYTPEAYRVYRASQSGSQSGCGLSFLVSDGAIQIYRVAGNSPAEESGLKEGMYVRGYGADRENIVSDVRTAAFSNYVADLPDEEPFTLLASETPEGEGVYYTLYKTAYVQNYAFYSDSEISCRFTGEKAETLTQGQTLLNDLPEDAAYIKIDSFAGDAARQFKELLEVLKNRNKKRLILDLRNNGGGQMSILCEIASYLCKNAADKKFPVATARYKNSGEEVFYADENRYGEYFSSDAEITVLANRNTASASEALIGAMLDYGGIGYEDVFLSEIDSVARSYGKGIMQTTYYNFLTGEAVKLTTATVHWPLSGNCIQDRGILPSDGAVPLPANGYVDCGDAALHTLIAGYFA